MWLVHRAGGDVALNAPGAFNAVRFMRVLSPDDVTHMNLWRPANFATRIDHLKFKRRTTPNKQWGSDPRICHLEDPPFTH